MLVHAYEYDASGQLTVEQVEDDSSTTVTTYVYDPVGNRLTLEVDGAVTTSTYNVANQLLTAEDGAGVTTYTYDANGNQTTIEVPSGDVTTQTCTCENQLAGVERPDGSEVAYAYAPVTQRADELRISKEVDGNEVYYLWDTENLFQEIDDVGTVEAAYTYNPQAYGHLVSQQRANEASYYHFDALGSTQALTDDAGAVTDEYTYSAFGEETKQTGTTANPYTWVGQVGYYHDEDAGRYTLRRREYSATQGRFLSEDPIGFEGGDANLYRYVENEPVRGRDPSGLATVFNPATGGVVNVPDVALDSYLENNPGAFIVSDGPHLPYQLTPDNCRLPAPFLPGEHQQSGPNDTCGPDVYANLVKTLRNAEKVALSNQFKTVTDTRSPLRVTKSILAWNCNLGQTKWDIEQLFSSPPISTTECQPKTNCCKRCMTVLGKVHDRYEINYIGSSRKFVADSQAESGFMSSLPQKNRIRIR